MLGRRLLRTALVAAAAVTLGSGVVAACSSDDDEPSGVRHPVATAVRELQDAFESEDAAAICDRMTRAARAQAGKMAHGGPTTCERDVRRAFEIIAGDGWDAGEKPVVTDVHASGSRASARIEQGTWPADVELARRDGAWKLAGFFGMPPTEFERFEEDLRSFPFRGFGSTPIEVVDGRDVPCPDLSDRFHPQITGGCAFRVSGEDVPIRMLTAFGDFTLADCTVGYRVAASPRGDTWTNELEVVEDGAQPGCSGISPCLTESGEPRPWTGRLDRLNADGYTHHMLMCLRTRIGLFGGELVTRLVRDGGGWKVEPADRGETGFRLDRELAVTGAPFNLKSDW